MIIKIWKTIEQNQELTVERIHKRSFSSRTLKLDHVISRQQSIRKHLQDYNYEMDSASLYIIKKREKSVQRNGKYKEWEIEAKYMTVNDDFFLEDPIYQYEYEEEDEHLGEDQKLLDAWNDLVNQYQYVPN